MTDSRLDRQWSAGALLRFALPTIAMMLFMGLYTIVDTIFVARFVNTDALSSINIVCPVLNVTVGLGTMLAAGGNAIVSRRLGAGEHQAAKETFTLLILTGAGLGVLILLIGAIWLDPILRALGASERLLPYCRDYLMALLLFIPANVLQTLFSNLFITAGQPVSSTRNLCSTPCLSATRWASHRSSVFFMAAETPFSKKRFSPSACGLSGRPPD